METMEQLIQKYQALKAQIEELEAAKKDIAGKFKAGLTAFGVAALRIPVGDQTFQLKITSRATHSCQWEAFKAVHPDLYAQFVSDGSTQYVDVRPVRANGPAAPETEETLESAL
jgi:hypothetical protein